MTEKLINGLVVSSSLLMQLCLVVARAYGFSALATAPAYAWSVPVLLVFSIFQTSRIRGRSLSHEH